MPILGTQASQNTKSFLAVWQAAQTFNSTQNYTATANVSEIAVVVISGGYAGGGGGPSVYQGINYAYDDTVFGGGSGGSGGSGGRAYSGVFSIPAGGATYLVTVGASGGGTSSIGSILDSNGNGSATSKSAGTAQDSSGVGGTVTVGSGLFTPVNYSYGGGGGVGANAAGYLDGSGSYSPPSNGSSPYGGNGGNTGSSNPGQGGIAGGAATGPSGGGGGGGGGYGRQAANPYAGHGGGAGGAGGVGQVIIYEKKAV